MYAIVKTGGKQYRVEQGQSLLVERLPVEDGGKATLQPLLFVDGDNLVDGEGLAKVSVQASVVGHERGPKLRVVKFKPKRGYRRRTGHRQELTRIQITGIKLSGRGASSSSKKTPKPVAADSEPGGSPMPAEGKPARARRQRSEASTSEKKPARPRTKRSPAPPSPETGDGA